MKLSKKYSNILSFIVLLFLILTLVSIRLNSHNETTEIKIATIKESNIVCIGGYQYYKIYNRNNIPSYIQKGQNGFSGWVADPCNGGNTKCQ